MRYFQHILIMESWSGLPERDLDVDRNLARKFEVCEDCLPVNMVKHWILMEADKNRQIVSLKSEKIFSPKI
jgi:hypothetical protein